MPTYRTPEPVDLAVNLPLGHIDVIASDRTDAVVTVSPSSPDKPADQRGAAATTVEFDGRRITVLGPRPRFRFLGPSESVDITVELPEGSRFTAECSTGGVRATGRLAATRVKASVGAVDLDATGDLWLHAAYGNATVGTVDGSAEVVAGHGQIRIGTVAGDAALKSSYGSVHLGTAHAAVEATLSYGDLHIDGSASSVTARTAYGSVTVGEARGGALDLESSFGTIVVGVADGVPAWLDLSSTQGQLRNRLDGSTVPSTGEHVSIRARTLYGDIEIRRAHSVSDSARSVEDEGTRS